MTVETSRGAEQTISTAKYEVTGRGGKGRELLQRGSSRAWARDAQLPKARWSGGSAASASPRVGPPPRRSLPGLQRRSRWSRGIAEPVRRPAASAFASRSEEKRARRTTSRTPGSSGSRRLSSSACGWASISRRRLGATRTARATRCPSGPTSCSARRACVLRERSSGPRACMTKRSAPSATADRWTGALSTPSTSRKVTRSRTACARCTGEPFASASPARSRAGWPRRVVASARSSADHGEKMPRCVADPRALATRRVPGEPPAGSREPC
jgi:hypothetical protein